MKKEQEGERGRTLLLMILATLVRAGFVLIWNCSSNWDRSSLSRAELTSSPDQ